MIHIYRIDYIGLDGQQLCHKDVDLWHVRSGIDTMMNYFRAVWNMRQHAGCSVVLCSYKDYSRKHNYHDTKRNR